MRAGDFKNIAPKQTDANQSHATQLDVATYERVVTHSRVVFSHKQSHMFSLKSWEGLSVIHPPTRITWEILFWPDMWFETPEPRWEHSLSRYMFSPFILHMDWKHTHITEPWHVLNTIHMPWWCWCTCHIQEIRTTAVLRLDAPFQLLWTKVRMSGNLSCAQVELHMLLRFPDYMHARVCVQTFLCVHE